MHRSLLATEFLDRARNHYGDQEAVVATTGERYTYEQLGERADGFSAALQVRGVEKGDRVAVLDPNTHYISKPPTESYRLAESTRYSTIDSRPTISSISPPTPA